MRFLRMLTNSLLAGLLGAAYLAVVVLQLNPQVPLFSITAARWLGVLALLYGIHLATTFYVVVVVREFFALDGFSPGWASVRLLAWMAAASAAVAATLMWLNLRGFTAALPDLAGRRMMAGAFATSVSAVVLLGIAVAHYSFGRRGSRLVGGLFVLAAVASLGLPLAARGRGTFDARLLTASASADSAGRQPGPRVTMLLLDGGSLEYIWPRVADGRLPNFARLLEGGASIDLATTRPTQSDPVWTAVATGMYPARSGVRSAGQYYAGADSRAVDLLPDHCLSHALVLLGFVREAPNDPAQLKGRPIWSILARSGISVGVVRWPLTYPAPTVPGFVVSDRFHQVVGSIADFDRAASPPDILPMLQAAFTSADPGDAVADPSGIPAPERPAVDRDRRYGRVMRELRRRFDPRFTAVRYEALDTVGQYYLRYTQPRSFGNVPEEWRRHYAQVFDRQYAFVDNEIGAALDGMQAGDIVLVVSGFGIDPINPLKRLLGRLLGDPDFTGTHERAPEGFLLAYGSNVAPGRHQRGSVVDVAPTLLYFMGLPIARDMDGYARTDLFTPAFTAERPVAFIPSYSDY